MGTGFGNNVRRDRRDGTRDPKSPKYSSMSAVTFLISQSMIFPANELKFIGLGLSEKGSSQKMESLANSRSVSKMVVKTLSSVKLSETTDTGGVPEKQTNGILDAMNLKLVESEPLIGFVDLGTQMAVKNSI